VRFIVAKFPVLLAAAALGVVFLEDRKGVRRALFGCVEAHFDICNLGGIYDFAAAGDDT
jgi:hypothetical protein